MPKKKKVTKEIKKQKKNKNLNKPVKEKRGMIKKNICQKSLIQIKIF